MINNFDWDELYNKATEFLTKNKIPATVKTNRKTVIGKEPIITISLMVKGNKESISRLTRCKYFVRLTGERLGGHLYMVGYLFVGRIEEV